MSLQASLFLLASVFCVGLASKPTGLLCDLQKHPARGVRAVPSFGWIVPPCSEGPNHLQKAYQLQVSSLVRKDLVWDSGKVSSNESINVMYGGPNLEPGTPYEWTVSTWTESSDGGGQMCKSELSLPATFITSLFGGWSRQARFIGIHNESATFAYFRKEIAIASSEIASAIGFVTARVEPKLLCGYRLYINDELVDVGPGRGEAPVWGGDGRFRIPYTTLDLTSYLQSSSSDTTVIALQAMHNHPPSVMMQLHLFYRNGTVAKTVTDETWLGFNGDIHRNPGPPQHGGSAGTDFLEYLDARHEPVGWMLPTFEAGANWEPVTASVPTAKDMHNLHAKMEPPMQLANIEVRTIMPIPIPTTLSPWTSFLADFGKEFQGGLRLHVMDGKAGETVHIACGESLDGTTVGDKWGWEFDWILREGTQYLEQHKYMECRYVSFTYAGEAPPPNFTLSAWQVQYPWDKDDSQFVSSNPTLNAVWELCRYTLQAGVLDTYTDSNTRERQPYEADGIIAATARLFLQRDYLWARHSHSWVLTYPTWPVEWKQLSPFLGWQDYMATGQPDLALAFMETMYNRTMISFLNSTCGLLDTSNMGSHIIDWFPDPSEGGDDVTVKLHEFTASNHMSVTNMFAAHGLDLLAQLMEVGGRPEFSTKFASEATRLKNNIFEHMWNGSAFCDGVCSEVGGNSLVMTNMFSLCFGMVPKKYLPSVWGTVVSWGLEHMGDYGAFWYQTALASGYYAPPYDTPDDGTAMYKALTKCDRYSWCSGLRDDNLTMTRETWHGGTYSHPWGASAIVGVVWGIMGIHQTSPGFASFIVKPKLGGLCHASITLPTIRGYIHMTASCTGLLEVQVPCNTAATLCLPRSNAQTHDNAGHQEFSTLLIDGMEVPAVASGGHICARQVVGCGRDGSPRRLESSVKMNMSLS